MAYDPVEQRAFGKIASGALFYFAGRLAVSVLWLVTSKIFHHASPNVESGKR